MGFADRPSLTVEIVLSRDNMPNTSTSNVPVYYCGEEINGCLRVLTSYDLYFDIVLSLEGRCVMYLMRLNSAKAWYRTY